MFSPDDLWREPMEDVSLKSDEVHVWRSSLDLPASYLDSLLRTLAPDEQTRAGRFHFLEDQQHFIAARGILRAMLSRYLGVEPARLRFCYGDHGKPNLVKEFGGDALRFNISHSHGLALFAVARNREVGIDVEWVRSDIETDKIAGRFFSTLEVATLRGLPIGLQKVAFFNCWTRKEAYIKARGEGLSMPLDKFDVSLAPGADAALLCTRAEPPEADRWSLRELFPGEGYVAAVAAQGKDWRLICRQWPVRTPES
jgi:4'-phosphopantetheinyl transferase